MRAPDAISCRRALREINEIAAVSLLDDTRMSHVEALSTISAIAEWAEVEIADTGVDCGDVLLRISRLTSSEDLEDLDDRRAVRLFNAVLDVLTVRPG